MKITLGLNPLPYIPLSVKPPLLFKSKSVFLWLLQGTALTTCHFFFFYWTNQRLAVRHVTCVLECACV